MSLSRSEEMHRLTENVYKTIMEQFNPSLRNFIAMGKNYEKALAGVTYAAKGYFDALVKMGELASESQGSKELGDVLFQMAEVHRQIQNQLEEMLKSFHNELLTQLEQKVELDSRYLSAALKKYQTEQRSKGDALDKCQAELKKLRKKSQGSKNPQKYSDKELQYIDAISSKQGELESYVSARMGAGRRVQTFFLGIILLPVRALLLALVLLLAWPFAAVSTVCCPEKLTHPLTGWRRKITQPVLKFLGRAMFFSMGFVVTVKGKIASPTEAPIFVAAPHSSFFDGIACVAAGLPSMVSRNENAQVPLIGRLLRALQPVLVSRVDPDSRKNTINEIIRRATSGGEWPQILVFPEGTCTNRSCLITFKPGAFIPGVPVQPILLRYPNELDTVTWTWQGYTFFQLCVLTFCQPFTRVEVEFMPVQVPNAEEKRDPVLFAGRVRNLMAEALGIPVTDHTYEDCRLMISAGQLTLPMEAGLVEFTKISRKLKLDWDGVRKHLDEYAAIASASKGGRIGIEEFAEYLKFPVSDVLRQLFALFDRNHDGSIDFREYVIGLAVLCNPANTEEIIQVAFKLFDVDEDGYITEEEFSTILQASLGVPDLDVSGLFKEIAHGDSVSYEEFKSFALKHPEYARIFTTYLDLQAGHVFSLPEEGPAAPFVASNKVSPESHDDSPSDKKDD